MVRRLSVAAGDYNYKARFYSTTLGRFVSADARESSGGSPCDVPHLCNVAKSVGKAVAEHACALAGTQSGACEAVKATIVDTGFYKTQCFRGLTKAGATGFVGYAAFQSGAGEAGLAYEFTGSALTAMSAFGIAANGPTGARPTQLTGFITGMWEDIRHGCF